MFALYSCSISDSQKHVHACCGYYCPCQPRQKRANNLQEVIEQLSANKADRRELLELKQFMVSLNVSLRGLGG